MKVNDWNKFWVVVCFVGGLLLMPFVEWCLHGWHAQASTLLAATPIVVLLVVGLFAVIWWIAKSKSMDLDQRSWRYCVQSAVIGVIVGLLFGVGIVSLRDYAGDGHANMALVQTVVIAVQTLVLAATLLYVYKYVVAARKSAVAALAQVEVARQVAVGAAPFVSDPILTVAQFAEEHEVHDVIKEMWGDAADDRLMIEITNEGIGAAMNVKVTAKWPLHDGNDKKADCKEGWMPSTPREEGWNKNSLSFGKAPGVPPEKRTPWQNGLQPHVWRIWRLERKHKALLYFTDPTPKEKWQLELTWHDVFYQHEPVVPIKMVWEHDHWSTDWGEAAKLWRARVKQVIKEMARITEEIGE